MPKPLFGEAKLVVGEEPQLLGVGAAQELVLGEMQPLAGAEDVVVERPRGMLDLGQRLSITGCEEKFERACCRWSPMRLLSRAIASQKRMRSPAEKPADSSSA